MARMLMIVERFPPDVGGLARSGARIAGAVARLGLEVDVLAWTRTVPPGALESGDAGEVFAPAAGATLHRLGLYRNLDFSLQHTLNVLEWLHDTQRYDLVWGHYLFPAGFVATWFAEGAGIPAVVSARGNDVDRLMFPPGDFARLRWTLERAQRVACVSQDLAGKVRRLLGPGHEPRVLVVPNAVDSETFAPGEPDPGLRASLGIAPEEAVLTFSGELREKKGLPFLLEALRTVQAERPACLLVIGEVRPKERAALVNLRREDPQAADRILVTGRLETPEEVARHLLLGDVFLHPSLWDGLPNAVLEAMSCGKVILASDAGGIPECVDHGQTGYLVPRPQLHRLGEAALELLAMTPGERQACGARARAAVLERFTPAREAERLTQLLAGLSPSTAA